MQRKGHNTFSLINNNGGTSTRFLKLKNQLPSRLGAVEYTDCRRGKTPPRPNECPGYDTKQSDGEVPVMQGPWGIRSTPSLPLLPGPLWPGMVAPDSSI